MARSLSDPTFRRAPAGGGHPIAALSRALDVRRQRRALERLDDTALHDLGLTRADVAREASRPIWSLPRF